MKDSVNNDEKLFILVAYEYYSGGFFFVLKPVIKHCMLGMSVSPVEEIHRHITWVGFKPTAFAMLEQMSSGIWLKSLIFQFKFETIFLGRRNRFILVSSFQ